MGGQRKQERLKCSAGRIKPMLLEWTTVPLVNPVLYGGHGIFLSKPTPSSTILNMFYFIRAKQFYFCSIPPWNIPPNQGLPKFQQGCVKLVEGFPQYRIQVTQFKWVTSVPDKQLHMGNPELERGDRMENHLYPVFIRLGEAGHPQRMGIFKQSVPVRSHVRNSV